MLSVFVISLKGVLSSIKSIVILGVQFLRLFGKQLSSSLTIKLRILFSDLSKYVP